jgi:NADH:ubiquinone oxidoreductase subunit C
MPDEVLPLASLKALQHFGARPAMADGIATLWTDRDALLGELARRKREFAVLLDMTAIDERARKHKDKRAADFTLVYHLLRHQDGLQLRVKLALSEAAMSVPSVCGLWANANWYEREIFDMFGISFEGHPDLRRILMPENPFLPRDGAGAVYHAARNVAGGAGGLAGGAGLRRAGGPGR